MEGGGGAAGTSAPVRKANFKFKKRKRKRGNIRESTIQTIEDGKTTASAPLPQLVPSIQKVKQMASKRMRTAGLKASTGDRERAGAGAHVVRQKSERNAAPAETGDKHITAVVEPTKRDAKFRGKPKWVGPRKAPSNIRMTTVVDYNPSLCKDYNETGFCGYGNSCKYLHDRGDYKAGWQLEKEWEAKQERERRLLQGDDVSDEENFEISSDEDLPFACHICRTDFTNPVVTLCGHYFCESCAIKRYAKSKRCAICKEDTQGNFKTAHKLLDRLEKKRERAEREGGGGQEGAEDAPPQQSNGWAIPGGASRMEQEKRV